MIALRFASPTCAPVRAMLTFIAACGSTSAAPDPSPSPTGEAPTSGPTKDASPEAEPPVLSPPASRCQATAAEVTCSSHSLSLLAQVLPRDVHYELPIGAAPAKGWPAVIFFQGSFVAASASFAAKNGDRFGTFHLTLTIKELLDHGYAVLAPNAAVAGRTAWQTNVPPASELWSASSDHAFMSAIFDAIGEGKLGALDASRLYAMGISSGGFMTSRMAVSYPGRFRALAINSGGYATCGLTCSMPTPLPSDHPPTLLLHGAADTTVAPSTMEMYRDELLTEGRTVKTVLDPKAGHEWLAAGPSAIRAWFDATP